MTAPSPRCGRLDAHPPHTWPGHNPPGPRACPGRVVVEGGATCPDCQAPVAGCGCAWWLARERGEEWGVA